MPASIRSRAFFVARRAACPLFLCALLLPALLLGCDSFGTGSSGLSLTADVESISPSDSTVTLTLTNDSSSRVYADFLCGLAIARKIDGRWERATLVNTICALINGTGLSSNRTGLSSRQSDDVIAVLSNLGPVGPGESVSLPVTFQRDLQETSAVRFSVGLAYQKETSQLPGKSRSSTTQGESDAVHRKSATVSNRIAFPDESLTSRGNLITTEIRVDP